MARPNAEQVRAFRDGCLSVLPEKFKMVFLVYEESDDYYGARGPITPSVHVKGRNGIVNLAVQEYRESRYGADCNPPKAMAEVITWAREALGAEQDGIHVHAYTAKQYREFEERKAREKAEPIIANICQRYQVHLGSLKMVAALFKHYDSIMESERHFRDDGESRAERWAACSYSGAGSAGFYSDDDYASSKIIEASDNLETAIEYLYKYCPLLMAQWEERKRRKAK